MLKRQVRNRQWAGIWTEKCTAVVGTHTHVQTADNRILPKGTAYITDVGMTGPYDGILRYGTRSSYYSGF